MFHTIIRNTWTRLLLQLLVTYLTTLLFEYSALAETGQYQHYSALLPAFGSLCEGGPVACNRIDSPLAADLRLDILPFWNSKSKSHGTFLPISLSVPFFEHIEGGVGFVYAQWREPSQFAQSSLGPLILSGKAVVWPLFSSPSLQSSIGIQFQHEQSVGPFSGINSLGSHGSLGSVRVSYNYPWPLVDLGFSLGVLFDWAGAYGEGEAGARISLKVPPRAPNEISIFVEALARSLAWGGVSPALGGLIVGVNIRTEAGFENALFVQVSKTPESVQLMAGLRLVSLHFGPHYRTIEVIHNFFSESLPKSKD